MHRNHLLIVSPPGTARYKDLVHHGFSYAISAADDAQGIEEVILAQEANACVFYWKSTHSKWLLEPLKILHTNSALRHVGLVVISDSEMPEREIVKTLNAGADDVIAFPSSTIEISARLRAVIRSRVHLQPKKIMQAGDLILDTDSHRVIYKGDTIPMNNRCFTILEMLMKSPGKVFPRETILDRITKIETTPAKRNVDVAIHNLRKGLGEASEMIEAVKGVGYRISA